MRLVSVRLLCFVGMLGITLIGCADSKVPPDDAVSSGNPTAAGRAYLLADPPGEAIGVIQARQAAGDGQTVVVTGRIGGGQDPWVKGLAAFSLVDLSLQACSDRMEDDCPTPWDYCCEAELPQARLLVKLVDDAGKVVPSDARQFLGVKELQTLVVSGRAKRDDAGNLTILAQHVHVQDDPE